MEKEKVKNILNKNSTYIFIGIAVLLLAVGAFYFTSEKPQSTEEKTLATVNGEEIKQSQVKEIREATAAQGQQISKKEAVDQAINMKLLTQKADEEGYSLTKEEAKQDLESQLAKQDASLEDLKQQAESQGQDYQRLLENYQKQRAIRQYIEQNLQGQITVSDSEAEEFYEQNKEMIGGEKAPSFEQVKEQIKLSLEQQKQQQAIQGVIQDLRSDAEIEYAQDLNTQNLQLQENQMQGEEVKIVN